jgi:hypothetical protein
MKYLFHFNEHDYIFESPEDGGTNKRQKTDFLGQQQFKKRIQYVFNDAGLYLRLKKAPGCLSVRISKVQVLYNNNCLMGLHAEYTAKLSDGTVITTRATPHHHNHGVYARSGGKAQVYSFELKDDDEYITDVLTRQGEITTQITFITNKGRRESFGGTAGSRESTTPQRSENYRVVALAGTVNGVIETVGFFAEPMGDGETLESLPVVRYRTDKCQRLLEKKNRRRVPADDDAVEASVDKVVPSSMDGSTNGSTKKRRCSEI